MAIPFARSMRSLDADSFRVSGVVLLIAGLLLAAWCGWFFLAKVSLYELSESARVEVAAASNPVEAPVAARIVATHVTLGEEVAAGDLLFELEARSEALELEEERSTRAANESELSELRQEIESERDALDRSSQAARLEFQEARASLREAEAATKYATTEATKIQVLFDQGLKSDTELKKAQSELEKASAIEEGRRLAVSRIEQELAVERRDRGSRIERLERQLSQIEGAITTSEHVEQRLGVELDKRAIRAPVGGTIGGIAQGLRTGAYVAAGDKLCDIVPRGDGHRVVAEFEPAKAVGRIKPGQPARLRLDSYPWAQFGVVEARVSSVGSEMRDGRVRVELAIDPGVPSGIILEHGLPGELEVEVETASPAILVLRSVGKLVGGA
jgi:membrane fusion protein (multidrug efflux system)